MKSPSPPPISSPSPHSNKAHKFLIITLTVFAVTFVALCFYILYFKIYLNWRASRRSASSQPPQTDDDETHDDFLDEDHGPVVDHHIWYINTVGLQPSIIGAITVCKYKKGDGLVEGSECSVCLNEFEEDETLRLLPKCNHAFHVPCIDTWLRSHTNCPMCRAPIVKYNTSGESSSSSTTPDSITDNSAVSSDTQVEVLRDDGETERELEEEILERRIGIEPIRRSVSLDSVSAFKISRVVGNFSIEEESRGNSDAQMGKEKDSRMRIVSRRVSRTESLRRFVGSSSIARSLQIGPVSFKRSFSCSGKFLLPRSS
ncbi:hypothetical protein Pint_33398 [Pistacia integerrima]|uniref:Uncharacterized protein n=1 Tax=Pistacia integerrima TaxID=434235 RepID=A0ACC0X6C1_9ROSI|nr:hypothetical protein Pint_33398 [Pistacia integerrima]